MVYCCLRSRNSCCAVQSKIYWRNTSKRYWILQDSDSGMLQWELLILWDLSITWSFLFHNILKNVLVFVFRWIKESDAKFIISVLVSETKWRKTSKKWTISKLIHRVRQMFYLHIFSSQQLCDFRKCNLLDIDCPRKSMFLLWEVEYENLFIGFREILLPKS